MEPEPARALGKLPRGDIPHFRGPVPTHAAVVDEVRVGQFRQGVRRASSRMIEWSRNPRIQASVGCTSGGSPTIAVSKRGPVSGEDRELHVGQRADRRLAPS